MTAHQLHELYLKNHPPQTSVGAVDTPVVTPQKVRPTPGVTDSPAVQPDPSPPEYRGRYSCKDLEHLWIKEGGNPNAAFIAAEIATAESGGNPNAISPTSDYGLWQINWSHNPSDPSIFLNPVVNVRTAIALSGNGTNWGQWTTYTSGAYIGRCLDG